MTEGGFSAAPNLRGNNSLISLPQSVFCVLLMHRSKLKHPVKAEGSGESLCAYSALCTRIKETPRTWQSSTMDGAVPTQTLLMVMRHKEGVREIKFSKYNIKHLIKSHPESDVS